MPWNHALTAAGLAAVVAMGMPHAAAHGQALSPEPPPAALQGPQAASRLLLTLHSGEDVTGRVLGREVLECDPDGGSHPDPGPACAALRAAGGDFGRLHSRPGMMCPMIYAPVTAQATGVWAGRPVLFTHSYANRCAAAVESGGVFTF